MAIDYSIYDFKKSFTVREAAQAWAETEYEPENARKAYQAISAELLRDVKNGTLQCRVYRDIRKNWINWDSDYSDHTDWSSAEIWADDLRRWAEGRGKKPKFLFPEMRPKPEPEEAVAPVKQKTAQPKAKRQNELHALLEKVYLALRFEFAREPDADEVLLVLKNRREEFDTDKIIDEVKDKRISWTRTDGTAGKPMGRKAVQNHVSGFKEKYKNQSLVKKIPA